jgi:hypothetical protein
MNAAPASPGFSHPPLEGAEKTVALKGRGFSRAETQFHH